MQERSQPARLSPLDITALDERLGGPGTVLAASLTALAFFVALGVGKEAPAIERDIRERADAAFAAAEIGWAHLAVDGRDVTVLGVAPSAAARNAAYILAAQLDGVRLARNRTTLRVASVARTHAAPPAAPGAVPLLPYSLVLRSDGAILTLAGEVPEAAETDRLLERAQRRFTVAAVHDELQRESRSVPAAWVDAATAALEALVLLERGEARFAGSEVEIEGVAADAGLRARTRQELLRLTPATFASAAHIALATDPGTTVQDCQAQIDSLLGAARIEFDRGSAVLRADSAPVVEELVEIAKRCQALRFEIAGHTDDRGGTRDNLTLSQQRAEAVMEYLVHHGVALRRLAARGYGEDRPLAPENTDEARARNRRIEVHAEPSPGA